MNIYIHTYIHTYIHCKFTILVNRGSPEGFGIYVSSIGEKYVGEWAANKKHGVG